MPRPSMQVSIERILKAHGFLQEFKSGTEFHVRIKNDPYMPLVIERHGNRVMVSHTFTQNGDVIFDPEIVFDYETWAPLEIEQPPMYLFNRIVGGRKTKFIEKDGKTYVRRNFNSEVMPLVRIWARNLRVQRFEHGKAESCTHERATT